MTFILSYLAFIIISFITILKTKYKLLERKKTPLFSIVYTAINKYY